MKKHPYEKPVLQHLGLLRDLTKQTGITTASLRKDPLDRTNGGA